MTTHNEHVYFGRFGRDDAGNAKLSNASIIERFEEMENSHPESEAKETDFWKCDLPSLECIAIDKGLVVFDEEAARSNGTRISVNRLRSESGKRMFAAFYKNTPAPVTAP